MVKFQGCLSFSFFVDVFVSDLQGSPSWLRLWSAMCLCMDHCSRPKCLPRSCTEFRLHHLLSYMTTIGSASRTASIRPYCPAKVLFDLSDQELHILDEFEDIEYTRLIVSPRILNTLGADGEPVVGTQVGDAQELIGSRCLEKVGTSQADTVEIGDDAVEISPGHAAGLGLTTEVTAYMYIWADQGDPDLVGDWEYEEWARTYLEDYVKMCEEFESELSKI
ncbi:uncharacterized protein [Physcomitrium patens]|uniref:uncharacterized protein isoform X2 n=1 Tax=Physcomitrium patens TaxID=3218 RepID=UPI000D15FADE|nr:uncharacterized protein LOC112276161 isoform X2 [Physcomitrium patens]|eukprot:XP_024363002.1 uncharacterized protein LOC112276161 isoform X2 [Physcomitrella patens]